MATVKSEKDLDDTPFVSNEVQIPDVSSQINQLKQEKADIIQELVKIKSENQKLNFNFQQKSNGTQTLVEQHLAGTMQLEKIIQGLENELVEWKQKCSIEVEKHNKSAITISSLKREKNELSAHLKQLRQSTNQPIQQNISVPEPDRIVDTEDEVYEVEALLRHKTVRRFLVRWKDFSSEHDSWVTEDDLNCTKLLKEYLKKKNLE